MDRRKDNKNKDERNDNNNNLTTIPGQFSDAEESMLDKTTEKFWKESIRVCDEVKRQHYGTNATITRIHTTTIQITRTNQLKPMKKSLTKQQKLAKNTMITKAGKNKKAKVQRHQPYNIKPAVTP